MIQIRNVPDKVHRTLKARAEREGMSLSDYIKRDLERTAALPSMREWIERASKLKPVNVRERPEVTIRKMRDGR
jgi:plasmid stability protein